MRRERFVRTASIGGAIVVVALVGWRMWFATRVPEDARPAIERYLEAVDGGRVEQLGGTAAALAPVLSSMRDVLGPRCGTGDATVAASHDGGARLDVEVPVTCERGPAVMELALTRTPGGPWSVSDGAARSAAFVWRFR